MRQAVGAAAPAEAIAAQFLAGLLRERTANAVQTPPLTRSNWLRRSLDGAVLLETANVKCYISLLLAEKGQRWLLVLDLLCLEREGDIP